MIKSAAYIEVKYCSHCKDPHIVLFDEEGNAFAEAVLYSELGPYLIRELQKVLYERAAESD
jgi:hypothetical protein